MKNQQRMQEASRTRPDLLIGKARPLERELYAAGSSEAERKTEFFRALMSDYSIDAISRNLITNFGEFDFVKLKKLHEGRSKSLTFKFRQYLGFGLAGSSLILKNVPKSVVETVFNIQYQDFEQILFWIVIGVTLYLGIVLVPFAWRYSRSKQKYDFVKRVLDYTVLLLE